MTERRDVDRVLSGDVEGRLVGIPGHVQAVDDEGLDAHAVTVDVIVHTPAGQTWSSIWATYSSLKYRRVLKIGLGALWPSPHKLVLLTMSARDSSVSRSSGTASPLVILSSSP